MLKDYLIRGYAVNRRIDKLAGDVQFLTNKVDEIDFHIKASLPPNEGIFYNGQIFDAYKFASDLIKTSRNSIILIDNYINEETPLLLAKRNKG